MNKKFTYDVILLFLLFLLQSSAYTVFGEITHFVPQLTMILVIIFALTHSLPEILWFSFISGFFLEFFSSLFWGAYVVAMIITGLLSYLATRRLAQQELSAPLTAFLIILGTLFFGFWVFSYDFLMVALDLSSGFGFGEWFSLKIFWTMFVNLIFFYPILLIYRLLPK